MIRRIFQTYQSSLLIAAINFATTVLVIRMIGSAGKGTLSLFTLNLSMITLISAVIGNGPLVFMFNRYRLSDLLILSSAWAIISGGLFSFLSVRVFSLVSINELPFLLALSVIGALNSNLLSIHAARTDFRSYNILRLVQSVLTALSITIGFYFYRINTLHFYLVTVIVVQMLVFSLSFTKLLQYSRLEASSNLWQTLIAFIKFGGVNQFNNLLQLGNYRYLLYLISKNMGLNATGVFSVVLTFAETIWLFKDSIVVNHHAEVARNRDWNFLRKLNTKMALISVAGTFFIILITFILPSDLYVFILGTDFLAVKETLLYMYPGVLAMSFGVIFSHFFSGIGKMYLNTIASLIAFVPLLTFGDYFLIRFGLSGAAILQSVSYGITTITLFMVYLFLKKKQSKI